MITVKNKDAAIKAVVESNLRLGDLIRLGDFNGEIPGTLDPGFYAVPVEIQGSPTELLDFCWVLIDSGYKAYAVRDNLDQLCRFLAGHMGTLVALSNVARALL